MENSAHESSFAVLSAEDDEDYFRLLNMILSRELKVDNVKHVIDGEELVNTLTRMIESKSEAPGLVLLDLNMPKKNGLEALAEIRANPNIPWIPIVVFTVSADPSDIDKCYENGANAFITKPTDLKELIETLGSAINFWKNLKKNTPVGV
jgi:CheY-like chemotaxis protein